MFGNENIGSGMRALSKILFWISALGSVAGGIVMLVYDNLWGIALIAGGIIGSYLLCYFIHAFGYLIEKTELQEEKEVRAEKTSERDQTEANQIPAGFTKVDIENKAELDALIEQRKKGEISEEEYTEKMKELL
jgi:hypothetical protein